MVTRRSAGMKLACGAALCAAGALAQACSAPAATTAAQPEIRRAVETAPADLQLVCAAEAAEVYELASDRVLPVGSTVEPGGVYTVILTAGDRRAVCTIDDDGRVLSMVET